MLLRLSMLLFAGGWLVLPQSGGRGGVFIESSGLSVRLLAGFEFTASSGVTPRTWTNEVILTTASVCRKFAYVYIVIN